MNIFLKDKKKLVSKILKYFEDMFIENGFVCVYKLYLVNVNVIIEYKKGKGGSVVLENGKEIMVSLFKKKELLSYFSWKNYEFINIILLYCIKMWNLYSSIE